MHAHKIGGGLVLVGDALPQARLELLGGYSLTSATGEPIPLSAKKPRALLAYLALAPGRAHSRERLAALLWADSSELQARTSLRQALTALRRTFEAGGPEVIAADATQVSLFPGTLAVDVAEFERALDLESAESLQRGLQLYRGDLLDGFSADAPAFEQWLVAERERLRTLAVKGLTALIAHQRAAGLTEQTLETAARLVTLDPLREEAQRELMRLYAQQGRIVEALKQYQLLRQVLARELGVPPTPETEQLYRDILLQRRSVPAGEAPPPAEALTACSDAAPPQVRHAIVLLTDLYRFTAFAGETDPEQVHHYLLRYRGHVEALVRQHGGVVTNFIGARMVAAFGVPVAHDDDAERAVRTALAMRAEVPDIEAPGGWKLMPHIGLASGGLFADSSLGPLVISGEPVSMAARIMEQAGAGEVFASGWVRHALGDRLQAEPLPTIAIRAAARPVQVWRIVQWLERVPSLRPFVGRQLELRQLAGLLESSLTTRTAHVVLVRGEAGIGKTRLLEELARLARPRGFAWQRVMVLDFGGGAGGRPIPALVRSLLGIGTRERARALAAVERAIVEGRVERDIAPFLYGMLELDAPPEYASGVPIEGAARQRAAQGVLTGLIRAQTQESPLLLVVEDIHWADEPTLDTLARAAGAARGLPVVLALSTRPEGDPIGAAWRAACAGCRLVTLDLGPLTAEEARELAASYHVQDEALVASCLQRAEGNPLFIDQLLRSAQSGSEALPSTVQSIVLARLDRLDTAQRQGLQGASVLGQRFTLDAVQHLLGGLPLPYEEPVDKGLVRPEGEGYMFSHALIQQAVYASLLRSRRHELHRRAAQWFETRDGVLHAEHLDAAEDPRAAHAYAQAAKLAAERHQQERALRLAQRGLALAQERALRHALTCLTGELLRELGRSEESMQASRDALALAVSPNEKAQALYGLASSLRVLDRIDEALQCVEQAEPYARESGDPAELAQLYFLRGNLYFPLGEIDACLAAHQRARAYAETAGSPVLEARALGSLGDAHYLRGEMLTAHDYFQRCVALSRERSLLGVASTCLPMLGITHFYRNELEAAYEACRAGEELARRTGNLRAELVARDVLATLHVFATRWDDALEEATQTLALARRVGARRFEADALGMLGVALWAQGKQVQGERTLEEGYEIAREVGIKHTGPWLLGSLARVTREPAKRDAALAQGESLLAQGCVSHSHLHFYENAIEACLEAHDLERVERYVDALRAYTSREPMPWSELHARRALALARFARNERSEDVRAELEAVAREAHHAGLMLPLARVEEALAVF